MTSTAPAPAPVPAAPASTGPAPAAPTDLPGAELERRIAQDPGSFRVLTGDRPTGPLHLGHYFGSLLNRVRLQNLGVDVIVLIPDYQVITDRDTAERLGEYTDGLLLDYLALGIDPARSTVFCHSAVPALNQLMLPFLSLVSVAELNRNPTVKDEIAHSRQSAVSGLMLTYPVHQVADILSCKETWFRSAGTRRPTWKSPGRSPAASTSGTATSSRNRTSCSPPRPCCSARTARR